MGRRAPSESTVRWVLQQAVDPDALDRVVTGWIAGRATTVTREPAGTGRAADSKAGVRAIALHGKTARDARQDGADGAWRDCTAARQSRSPPMRIGATAPRPDGPLELRP
jgi:hypothetical protein